MKKRIISTDHTCRPFIKWAGGKTQLVPELLRRVPKDFSCYYEPFIGGGALFFALRPAKARLSDLNEELINTYTMVRDKPSALVKELKQHRYERKYYYLIRNVDRSAEYRRWGKVAKASRFIFLNKSCFNGLYRVNSKGHFNTPFGSYVNPKIVDEKNLRACSKALAGVALKIAPFGDIEETIKKKDFVYFDPPYVPLNPTSSFTGYYKEGFNLEMQRELFKLCCRLDKRGVRFMLSNSSAPFVRDLYKRFKVELIPASRAINSKGSRRGKVNEVIVTNY